MMINDLHAAQQYQAKALEEIKLRLVQTYNPTTFGELADIQIWKLLTKAKAANFSAESRRAPEALFMTGKQARKMMDRETPRVPIITFDQQPYKWTSDRKPIEQFLSHIMIDNKLVYVQDRSQRLDQQSFLLQTLRQVRNRFMSSTKSSSPWNVLDLRIPYTNVFPSFLEGDNCSLLSVILHHLENTSNAGRELGKLLSSNVTRWALLSEGGNNTTPHMDAYGFSTWITVQQGVAGFGWLSQPTTEEEDAWKRDPATYTGGEWRFVILYPGQTIFLPAGTVHFVFRTEESQTFAIGGHIVQWTGVCHWLEVLIAQAKNSLITNEDMGNIAVHYVQTLRDLISQRHNNKRDCKTEALIKVSSLLI